MIAAPPARRKRFASVFVFGALVLLCAFAGLLVPSLFDMSPKAQNFLGLTLIAVLYLIALFIEPQAALWVGTIVATVFISFTGFQWEYKASGLRISAFDVLVGSFAIILLVLPKGKTVEWGAVEPKLKKRFQIFLACLPIGAIIALSRGVEPVRIAAMVKLFYYPMVLSYVLPRVLYTRRRLEVVLAIAIVLAVASAFSSRVQGPPLDQPILGPTTVKLERSYGQWGTSNPFANYLMFAVLIPAAFAMQPRRPAMAAAMALAAGVAGWGLLGTFTRGAWLGAGVAALFLVLSDRASKLVLVLLIACAVVAVLPSAVQERAVSYEDSSTTRRLNLWRTGYEITLDYPIAGAGWGASFYLMGGTLVPENSLPWWHNDYLVVSSQVGLLGLAAFLSMWLGIVSFGYRAGRATTDPFYRPLILGLTASLIGAMIHAFFEHVFWRFDTGPHTWFLASCLISAVLLSRSGHQEAAA